MKTKYFGVIYFDEKGNTYHVDVFFDKQRAIDAAILGGGMMECGIRRIIQRANWWNKKDTANYKMHWVLSNAV